MEAARRLNLSLNTVKRYARVPEPERLIRAPQYRPTLVDPYREHLRTRRAQDPAVPVLQLLEEIKALGYQGSQNLLYRYITQGRVESDRSSLSPRKVTRLLVTRPENLGEKDRELGAALTATCAEMTAIARATRAFARLLSPEGQREATCPLDRDRPGCRPTAPAGLHPRPGLRQGSRNRRPDPALSQRRNRGREHQDEAHHATDARQAGFTLLRHRKLLN